MLTKFLVAAVLAVALPAQADIVMEAQGPQGHRLELHNTTAPECPAETLHAVMVFPDGKELQGCWNVNKRGVLIAFDDGDVALFPHSIFHKPTKL
jgi:hypothetical protein